MTPNGGFLRSPTPRHASKWEKGTRERTDLNQTGSQNDTSNVRKYYIITYSIQKSNISIYARSLIPGDGFDVIVTTPGVGMVTGSGIGPLVMIPGSGIGGIVGSSILTTSSIAIGQLYLDHNCSH